MLDLLAEAVSQHLRVLLDAGLVTERRQGRERRYRLAPQRLGPVRDWLSEVRAVARDGVALADGPCNARRVDVYPNDFEPRVGTAQEHSMNILLWVLQVVLAFLYLAGGGFKALNPEDPARQIRAIPPAAWRAIGVFEVLGAVLLIIPGAANWMPALTPLAAAALALETLVMAVVYAQYSLKLVAANPLVYAVPMFVLAVLVAYGRYSLSPPV